MGTFRIYAGGNMPSDLKQKTGGFDIRITVVELYGGELNEQEKKIL